MRVFYVIYLRDGIAVDCIEAIRLLCNPVEKKASHLTVRGPFPNKIRLPDANRKLAGNKLLLNGVSHFFSETQNTIFFTCLATKIKRVWNKPEYPFNPHITIYDGASKTFAHALLNVMSQYRFFLGFHADKLNPLVSGNDVYQPLRFDSEAIAEITGVTLSPEMIISLDEEKRLSLIDALCIHLHNLSLKTAYNFLAQEKPSSERSFYDLMRNAFST